MHKIALTSKVWYLLEGTGVMQGEESPEIKAEMDALKWNKKGAHGSVSLDTVGWILDTLEALGDSTEPGEARAISAALAKLGSIYQDNGGTVTTYGELRAAEAKDDELDQEDEHQEEGEAEHTKHEQVPAPLVGGGATDCDLAETETVSSTGYGEPVFHVGTGALVGYLAPGRFTHISDT
ncbi:hypothetical protein [Streptomyces sp. NRRL S-241]|uniref:hypothetical protein n=1 Tax=Streptomyces sp. NRRL S-241 TaxID=1463896 RepID=UPI0004BE745D|nr:hypothetical protein [Streptomyces sp. NRRL S-241]